MRKTPQAYRTGFTLIELLVVIGIIVLLIGILIPAISGARTQAQKASTEALLTGIDGAIKKYSADFNGAVPGYLPQSATTASTGKLSGTQNLLLALSYSFSDSSVAVPGAGPVAWNKSSTSSGTYATPMVDPASPNGPTDYSVFPNKIQPAYYNPSQNDLKSIASGFTLTNYAAAWKTFPVIVDRFSSPLPILYFRRDLPSGNTWCSETPSTAASYYRTENAEYLDAGDTAASPDSTKFLHSTDGSAFNQLKSSSYSTANNGASNLGSAIQAAITGGASATSTRGDYVLISAGADRIYGKNGTATTSDDLIRVGTK